MDYLIVDRNQVNPKEESLYSEKIIYLPKIWNCHSGYNFKRSENEMPFQKINLLLLVHLIIFKN